MIDLERGIDRYLTLLRNTIRASGSTQLEVQEALGWGRSYISQFLTKQKKVRLEQVLSILNVIGIEPGAFFAELYGASPWSHDGGLQAPGVSAELRHQQLARVRELAHSLVDLLVEKKFITAAGLAGAVEAGESEPT